MIVPRKKETIETLERAQARIAELEEALERETARAKTLRDALENEERKKAPLSESTLEDLLEAIREPLEAVLREGDPQSETDPEKRWTYVTIQKALKQIP